MSTCYLPTCFLVYYPKEQIDRECSQERDQDVHPRLLRIVYLEGGAGGEEGSDEPHPCPEEAPSQEEGDRHQCRAHQGRQGSDGGLACAEGDDPEVEEVVIEGGMDVGCSVAGDGGQVSPGQGHAGPLVVPEALGPQVVEAQGQSQDHYGR